MFGLFPGNDVLFQFYKGSCSRRPCHLYRSGPCDLYKLIAFTNSIIMTGALLTGYLIYFYISTCLMQMPTDSQTRYKRYSGQGNMFMSSPKTTRSSMECAKTCTQSQPRCIGFTFEKKKSCDLLESLTPGSSTSKNTWISGNE